MTGGGTLNGTHLRISVCSVAELYLPESRAVRRKAAGVHFVVVSSLNDECAACRKVCNDAVKLFPGSVAGAVDVVIGCACNRCCGVYDHPDFLGMTSGVTGVITRLQANLFRDSVLIARLDGMGGDVPLLAGFHYSHGGAAGDGLAEYSHHRKRG